MSERYSRIYSLAENLYSEGAPVVIRAGALLKDNDNGGILAQLKINNIINKEIKLVKVAITYQDSLERPLGELLYEYIDLSVTRGVDFGAKNPIRIPDSTTRAFSVRVAEVGFSDNSFWEDKNFVWESLPKQSPIDALIENPYALSTYYAKFGEKASFEMLEHKDLWLCTCDAINHAGEEKCFKCGAESKTLKAINLDELESEGILAEKETLYSKACELYETGTSDSVSKSISILEEVGKYKNSEELLAKWREALVEILENEKDTKIAKKKKQKKILTISSIVASSIVMLGLLCYFFIYPLISYTSGDFDIYIEAFGITEFEIPDGTTEIKNYAFYGCEDLASITIPEGVTRIGESAFQGCSALTSVTIPSSVTSIADSAFYGCSSLTTITISDSVVNIGASAFYGCSSLNSITIPSSVTSIGKNAFYNCTGLEEINFNASAMNDLTSSSCIFDYAGTSANGITVNIGANVIRIPAYLFYHNYEHNISNISFVEGGICESIGEAAFKYCSGLTSITIPNGIITIESVAFFGCSNILSITIPESVTSIGTEAFLGCQALTEINFNASTLDDLTNSSNIFEHVGESGSGITINIGANVTKIPTYLFEGTKIVSVNFANNSICQSIEASAFKNCNELRSVTLSEGITSIGSNAFYGCYNLSSIIIPESVASLGEYAFYGCSNLATINFSNKITTVEKYTFYGCESLTGITISNVQNIGEYAFYGCKSLTNIEIPKVWVIKDYVFYGCENLTGITISNVRNIGKYAFYGCESLTDIETPNVSVIGSYAFYRCKSITSITLPAVLSEIGDYAFYICTNLNSVTMMDAAGLLIGNHSFDGCSKLTSVTIPRSVIYIGNYAFYNFNLDTITYNGTKSEWNKILKGSSCYSKYDTDIICTDGIVY